MDKITIDPTESIPAFYAGQSIFLTGGTGFLGKVYIEKILRSCPDICKIFILMRPKKEMTINERLNKMLNSPLYDKLREEQPINFKKLVPISGNASEENLGLSVVDRQMLTEKVTIIIHSAASVHFNNSLKHAILTNTRSTRDICVLAQSMKNLKALIYVGTAFAHANNFVIEEKMYSPITDWWKMIKVAELLDEHTLNIFTAKCLNNIHNTYIFSKNLAESVIQEYSSSLPCAIVRPSIVTSTLKDPIPGWIDNFNGPVGLFVAARKGLLQVGCCGNTSPNNIPVDIVINTIIIVSWKIGLTTFTPESGLPFVVNCTCPKEKERPYSEIGNISAKIANDVPFEGIIWTINPIYVESLAMYYVLVILWHILPALLIDLILKLSGRQSILLKLQRKIYVVSRVLQYFSCNEWKFDDTNVRALMSVIPSDDREIFSLDLSNLDIQHYYRNAMIGGKKYLLREDMNRLDVARAHRKRVYLFVATFKTIIAISMLIWIMYK